MHIALTVNAAWNLANFRRPLIEDFVRTGDRVTAIAPADASVPALTEMGCAFEPIVMDVKGLSPLRDAAAFWSLRKTFKRLHPDVILSFTVKNNIYGALAARSLGLPFIPNVTGLGTAFLSGGPLQRVAETLYRLAFRGLKVVFFQNSDDATLFVRRRLVSKQQVRLLPGSGIDLARFAPQPPPPGSGPVFLMIARLIRDKGVFEFVEASRLVRARHPDARFQLLGPVDAQNRTAISRSTLDDWVCEGLEYLGETQDVRPYIARADCLVLPSYREGAPRTLIEAAAMARPAIASDVPGCRSVVDHCVTGYLCEVRSGKSLAEACERFIGLSEAERDAMSRAARSKMEREFAQEQVVEAYRRAIADVCGDARVQG